MAWPPPCWPATIRRVWNTNHLSATVFALTLVATLFLPVQQAIFLGVLIHIFITIVQSAERMTIHELVPAPDGDFVIEPAPKELPSDRVTMLLPDGSLYFAAARDFEEEAPSAEDAKRAVVVLILRGRPRLGSTAIGVFERYARALQENGGVLYLAAVSESVRAQLEKTGVLDLIGQDHVLPESDLLLSSLRQAYDLATTRLEETRSTLTE